MKIGIIREGKIPVDRRTPLTPHQAREVVEKFGVEVVAQSSDVRTFRDEEYSKFGIQVVNSLGDCDVILGVKEVPIEMLIPEKMYFFFSHTIKKQSYNRKLLQAILNKKITLVDYEPLTNENGMRVIAFGRWAGIVGAYNGLWTYGRRYNLFDIRRAYECHDYDDLKSELKKIQLPQIKIVVTGGGRVAKGAMEILHNVGIRKVTPAVFINERFSEAVFTQLNTRDYTRKKGAGNFERSEFYSNPERYESDFLKYTRWADILIAGAYWDPKAPVLFDRYDVLDSAFRTKIIADITCDINGSIPSTKKPSTIDDPIYDFNPSEDKIEQALSDEANITVMSVDNLPCELPRDASESFGKDMIENVLPNLLGNDNGMIDRATIVRAGKLTKKYAYLTDYASQTDSMNPDSLKK